MSECHLLQMENAKVQLAYASQHIEKIRSNQSKLLDKLYELESKIQPRQQYGFIHGNWVLTMLWLMINWNPF